MGKRTSLSNYRRSTEYAFPVVRSIGVPFYLFAFRVPQSTNDQKKIAQNILAFFERANDAGVCNSILHRVHDCDGSR